MTPTRLAQVAGGLTIASALYLLVLAFQTMAAVRFNGPLGLIVPTMGALGVALLFCGWSVRRMRGWAAIGSTAVAALSAMMGVLWFGLSLSIGLLTIMPLIVVFAAATSGVLSAMTIGSARRADEARRRLAAADLQL